MLTPTARKATFLTPSDRNVAFLSFGAPVQEGR